MSEMAEVRQAVDRLLEGDLEPMLDLLAEDVEFEVAAGGGDCSRTTAWGKPPVAEYFAGLGGVVAFWQIDYGATGEQVVAWGKESFTVEHCELEGGSEFALVFDLFDGRIGRLLVVEDLPSFVRDGGSLAGRVPAGGGEGVLSVA